MIAGWGLVHHLERVVLGCASVMCVLGGASLQECPVALATPQLVESSGEGKGSTHPSEEVWTEGPGFWRRASSMHLTRRFTAAGAWLSLGRERGDHGEAEPQKGQEFRCRKPFFQEVAVQALKSPVPAGFSFSLNLWEEAAQVLFPLTASAAATEVAGGEHGK